MVRRQPDSRLSLPAVCPLGGEDCDDLSGEAHPGGTEACKDVDEDCDGVADNGCNVDGDAFCAEGMTVASGASGFPAVCPEGGGDCDDARKDIYPGAPAVCGPVAYDCGAIPHVAFGAPVPIRGHWAQTNSDVLAYNGTSFAIVWTEDADANRVGRYALVTPQGVLEAGPFLLEDLATSVEWVAVGYDAGSQLFAAADVVYRPTETTPHVAVTTFDATGAIASKRDLGPAWGYSGADILAGPAGTVLYGHPTAFGAPLQLVTLGALAGEPSAPLDLGVTAIDDSAFLPQPGGGAFTFVGADPPTKTLLVVDATTQTVLAGPTSVSYPNAENGYAPSLAVLGSTTYLAYAVSGGFLRAAPLVDADTAFAGDPITLADNYDNTSGFARAIIDEGSGYKAVFYPGIDAATGNEWTYMARFDGLGELNLSYLPSRAQDGRKTKYGEGDELGLVALGEPRKQSARRNGRPPFAVHEVQGAREVAFLDRLNDVGDLLGARRSRELLHPIVDPLAVRMDVLHRRWGCERTFASQNHGSGEAHTASYCGLCLAVDRGGARKCGEGLRAESKQRLIKQAAVVPQALKSFATTESLGLGHGSIVSFPDGDR